MFKTKNIKKSAGILFSILIMSAFITGCSSKREPLADNSTINKFYKDTSNTEIKNSKNMHKYTMRPYSVFGIKYHPFVANVGDEFRGIASWYGPDFHSKKTSNGEVYNMYALTAAHKTLPMNTVVKVHNLENGKSVVVRINDRGPFVKGRIIDLSNKAAHAIEMVRKGTANVKITVLGYNGEIENYDAPVVATTSIVGTPVKVVEDTPELEPLVIKETVVEATSKPIVVSSGDYSIQLGAFSKADGAIKTRDTYQSKFATNKVEAIRVFSNGKYLFKVFVKGFNSKHDAEVFKLENGLNKSIIVRN